MDETQGFKYIQDITLDLDCNGAYTTIAAKQGDNNSRIIKVHLTKNNIPYTIPSGGSAFFRCRKPDGHGVDAPAVINTEENVIEVTLTSQVLMVSGRAYCDVGFTADGILSSSAFILLIMASPSIASGEVSTDDFTRLTETINDANIMTTEAEAWATGRRGGTPVEPSAPQYNCNASYFATEASKAFNSVKNIQVSAIQSYASVEPTVSTSFEDNHLLITFGLPAGDTGATGPQGPSTVFVSNEQPVAAIASQYDIWFNNEGEPEKFAITGNQVTYNADYSSYETGTVGKAIQDANVEIDLLNTTINNLTPTINQAVADAQAAATEARDAAAGIENKIDNPTQGTTTGWHGYLKNEKTEDSYEISWSSGIPYDDITDKPAIQGIALTGDKTFGDLNFQAWSSLNLKASDLNYDDAAESGGILPEYLNIGLKNTVALATTAVQEIIFNGESYTSTDGQPINLGYSVTTSNIVNKNYLDNSWFEINQRGTTNYPSVGSSIYICDRWKTITTNENRTIQIVDDGILIGTAPSDSATKEINFGQIIGDDVWQSLSGKNLHASVEFKIDGTTDFIISDWDCVCPIYHTNQDPTTNRKQFYNLGSGTSSPGWGAKLYSDSEQLIFSIIWQGTSWDINDEYTDVSITIHRVKLEVSNYSTLKQEPKPIYLDELTKCQKYFRQYGGENYYSTGSVINVENTDTVIGIGIARSKRILDITMHGLGDMESPFSVAMPTGVVLQARRGFRAANSTGQPISVSVDQIKTYSYNPNVTNSTTLTEDFNFTYDSSTDTYTLATEYVANTSYFRKVYKKGLGNTLLATIDITADASQYYPYYLVLPATASDAQEASWIQFSAEP